MEQALTSFFLHWKNSKEFIYLWLNSNAWILALDGHWTKNLLGPSLDLITYRTDSKIIFWNIEGTWTCSSFGNRTWTPYFWLQTIEHPTLNIVRSIPNCPLTLLKFQFMKELEFYSQPNRDFGQNQIVGISFFTDFKSLEG